jgi:hypothetical protein
MKKYPYIFSNISYIRRKLLESIEENNINKIYDVLCKWNELLPKKYRLGFTQQSIICNNCNKETYINKIPKKFWICTICNGKNKTLETTVITDKILGDVTINSPPNQITKKWCLEFLSIIEQQSGKYRDDYKGNEK